MAADPLRYTRLPLLGASGDIPAMGFGTLIPDANATTASNCWIPWGAVEQLVEGGKCRDIGLSDASMEQLQAIYSRARIKPAVIQVGCRDRSVLEPPTRSQIE